MTSARKTTDSNAVSPYLDFGDSDDIHVWQ